MDQIRAELGAKKNGDPPSKGKKPLKLAGERFERLIAEVEDYVIILLDKDGTIMSWNRGAEKIKGYLPEEIIGKSYKIFYPREDVERGLPDLLLTNAAEKGKANYEGWRIKKDGTRFWGSITLTAIHDNSGNISGYLKVTRDLTERKISEDQYANHLEELRVKNEELRLSEMRYHSMVSEVRDYAIILLDVNGNVLDWNKGAQKLKGYKASEILGKSFRLFYPIEDKESNLPQKLLDEAAKNGFANHEGYRIKKDGTRFWGGVAITALHDETGNIIGYSKVTRDLTERKAADDRLAVFTQELTQKNEELRQSEERYHKMISEVQDYAILLLNYAGDIQNWNVGAAHIKGYSAKEIIGKNFRIFYTAEDIERRLPDRLLEEAELMGKAVSEGWRKRKDGSKFWGSIVITALHDVKGNVIGFSKVTRDLTERKNADDLLRNNALDLEFKNHQLERLNDELSSFAYVVSHDLKEPVRKIQLFANRQLEPGKTPEQLKEYSEKIIASASRMQKLMDALLSYSHIAGDPSEPEKIDLNQVLEDVKNDLEISISDSNTRIESEKLPVIRGISFQFQQLFLNLLSNAIKFSKKTESPLVRITTTIVSSVDLPEELIVKNKRYHRITFADNGVGFEQDQSNRIFEVFQRLKPNPDAKGTGIGLSIVKRVVQNHDGLVVARGKPDEGATFEIYLPVME